MTWWVCVLRPRAWDGWSVSDTHHINYISRRGWVSRRAHPILPANCANRGFPGTTVPGHFARVGLVLAGPVLAHFAPAGPVPEQVAPAGPLLGEFAWPGSLPAHFSRGRVGGFARGGGFCCGICHRICLGLLYRLYGYRLYWWRRLCWLDLRPCILAGRPSLELT